MCVPKVLSGMFCESYHSQLISDEGGIQAGYSIGEQLEYSSLLEEVEVLDTKYYTTSRDDGNFEKQKIFIYSIINNP